MKTDSYIGKGVIALFEQGSFIYKVEGILNESDENEMLFKDAYVYASSFMFGDKKIASGGYKCENSMEEIANGKRVSFDRKNLVTIIDIEE